jgi:hypothetical protein
MTKRGRVWLFIAGALIAVATLQTYLSVDMSLHDVSEQTPAPIFSTL